MSVSFYSDEQTDSSIYKREVVLYISTIVDRRTDERTEMRSRLSYFRHRVLAKIHHRVLAKIRHLVLFPRFSFPERKGDRRTDGRTRLLSDACIGENETLRPVRSYIIGRTDARTFK